MGDFKVRIGLWLNSKLIDIELDTSSSIPTKIVKIMYKLKCGKIKIIFTIISTCIGCIFSKIRRRTSTQIVFM